MSHPERVQLRAGVAEELRRLRAEVDAGHTARQSRMPRQHSARRKRGISAVIDKMFPCVILSALFGTPWAYGNVWLAAHGHWITSALSWALMALGAYAIWEIEHPKRAPRTESSDNIWDRRIDHALAAHPRLTRVAAWIACVLMYGGIGVFTLLVLGLIGLVIASIVVSVV